MEYRPDKDFPKPWVFIVVVVLLLIVNNSRMVSGLYHDSWNVPNPKNKKQKI